MLRISRDEADLVGGPLHDLGGAKLGLADQASPAGSAVASTQAHTCVTLPALKWADLVGLMSHRCADMVARPRAVQ